MTPDERAEKLVDKFWGSTEPTVIDRQMVKAIASEIRAAVEEATTKDRAEIEDLIWNLAGCSTFALGYGLDEPFDKSKARAAMFDVHALALRYRKAKAEAYEDAARIVDLFATDPYTSDTGAEAENMAAAIRARAAYEKVRGME